MANGGQLITPFVPRTAQEEYRSTPKVRRLININADSFKQMVPGMIGSVSYGSGRRAFNANETVAGKTGTCIEHGEWVGLFTSYAPLNNPRLAVVVIALGADGRNHFPAAVAGQIYRDLGSRFGAMTMEQIAAKRNTKTQSGGPTTGALTSPAETASLAADDEESEEADDASAKTGSQKSETVRTIWGDPRQPADRKVKRVLMSISNRTTETAKPAKTSPQKESKQIQTLRRVAGTK